MPRKGVIVYAGTSNWIRGKIDSLWKGRKTLYRAKFWNLPLEIRIAGLENTAAKAKITLESIGEGITKNYGVF